MDFLATPFNFSTTLLIGLACWVMYLRMKAPVENNIPLIYNGIMIYYTIMYASQVRVPPVLVFISLILALILRFEFMNAIVTKIVSLFEFCAIGMTIYFCLATIYRW